MSRSVVANTLGPRAFFEHLSQNYENEYWEYEKRLGFGAFGFTALLKRKGSSVQPAQRMAVKFAIGTDPRRRQTLHTEIDVLKMVNGASHIVSILASCPNIAKVTASRHSGDNNILISASDAFEGFVGIDGPAVALEYLEYGDIMGLVNKIRPTDRHVPNRILWSFFLCFIRASVGLAYPSRQPIGSNARILEELPSDHSPATESPMEHRDFNARNIMLAVGDEPEHEIGVMAKLIDFGLATDGVGTTGSPTNIFDAALTTSFLAAPKAGIPNTTCMYQESSTKAVNLVGTDEPPFPLPWLDPELRDILARCMYVHEQQRPTLQEALQVARDAVHSKTATSFQAPDMETDSAVNAFVQEFIFNVPQQ
ncbi:kinase-like protein [Nemania abortiva]|nr:kinase-like protein [Nemania abortiva]